MAVLLHPDVAMNYEKRDTFLKSATQQEPKKHLKTVLSTVLTKRFVEAFLAFCDIEKELYISQLRKDDRLRLCHYLGNGIPVTLLARRPGDEFVTAGGVDTKEVNEKTMESRITP